MLGETNGAVPNTSLLDSEPRHSHNTHFNDTEALSWTTENRKCTLMLQFTNYAAKRTWPFSVARQDTSRKVRAQ